MNTYLTDVLEMIQQVDIPYCLYNVDGNRLATSRDCSQELEEQLSDPTLISFQLTVGELLHGYIIVPIDALSDTEVRLLEQSLRLLGGQHATQEACNDDLTLNAFWRNFLLQEGTDEATTEDYRKQYGIPLEAQYSVAVIKTNGMQLGHQQIRAAVQPALRSQPHLTIVPISEHVHALILVSRTSIDYIARSLKRREREVLSYILKDREDGSCIMGMSDPIANFRDLPNAFTRVRDMVDVGAQLHTRSRMMLYARRPLYALLNDIRPRAALQYIRAVQKQVDLNDQDTVDMLNALNEHDGNISAAAKELDIHRNTIEYRLKKIQEEGALDPSSFEDMMQIQIALALKELYDE
jgi:sugar diacid utilization regulator